MSEIRAEVRGREAGQDKVVVEIAAPVEPRDGECSHRVTVRRADGSPDETYLAPDLDCALAVAGLLLTGLPVPRDYFRRDGGTNR